MPEQPYDYNSAQPLIEKDGTPSQVFRTWMLRVIGTLSGGTGPDSGVNHALLSNVQPDQHHAKFHSHNASDGSGVVAHASLSDRSAANAHPITAITDFQDIYQTVPMLGTGMVWTGTKWESLNIWVTAGYGGIQRDTPAGTPDIGSGWTILTADAGALASPRGLTQDHATNSIAFNIAGVWSISLAFSLSHNETQSSRTVEVRIFDITAGSAGNATVVGVGRNTDTTTFGTTILVDIPDDEVGDQWRVEVSGGADVLSSVVENSFDFNASLVSEFRG